MEGRPEGVRQALRTLKLRGLGLRFALIAALVLFVCAVVPIVAIVAGGLLIVAVAVHVAWPELRPLVEPVLRVPVGRARARYARLAFMAGLGVLCIASGSLGAAQRGQWLGERGQRERERELAATHTDELLARATEHLAAGDVSAAELLLLEAQALGDEDREARAEVEDLLGRVRRSGDPEAILDILTHLPRDEFEAFRSGAAVPEDLDFGERVLTRRAVELARAQIDQALTLRARR